MVYTLYLAPSTGLIRSLIVAALESDSSEGLTAGFLLARQASLEGPHVFQSYTAWFQVRACSRWQSRLVALIAFRCYLAHKEVCCGHAFSLQMVRVRVCRYGQCISQRRTGIIASGCTCPLLLTWVNRIGKWRTMTTPHTFASPLFRSVLFPPICILPALPTVHVCFVRSVFSLVGSYSPCDSPCSPCLQTDSSGAF